MPDHLANLIVMVLGMLLGIDLIFVKRMKEGRLKSYLSVLWVLLLIFAVIIVTKQ